MHAPSSETDDRPSLCCDKIEKREPGACVGTGPEQRKIRLKRKKKPPPSIEWQQILYYIIIYEICVRNPGSSWITILMCRDSSRRRRISLPDAPDAATGDSCKRRGCAPTSASTRPKARASTPAAILPWPWHRMAIRGSSAGRNGDSRVQRLNPIGPTKPWRTLKAPASAISKTLPIRAATENPGWHAHLRSVLDSRITKQLGGGP